MSDSQQFWDELFVRAENRTGGRQIELRLLRKHGRAFLLLPAKGQSAAACLNLYPAQTRVARAAKALLRCLLRAAIPIGTRKISLTISPDDPFVKFLESQAQEPAGAIPEMGILAGNPATEGQRLIILLFDRRQRPAAVVKAGLSGRAKALIEKEAAFLAAAPPNIHGLPRLRATFKIPRVQAMALDFFTGDSPGRRHESALPGLLASWLNSNRQLPLSEMTEWSRLEQAAPSDQLQSLGAAQLRNRILRPAIQHGDFAPWNIKVSPGGAWTVLDWERGQLNGIPGWDWFHYVIQPAILVQHEPIAALVERIERFLRSEAFKQYAQESAISGIERSLLLAYVLHSIHVIKPSEGLPQTQELLRALSES